MTWTPLLRKISYADLATEEFTYLAYNVSLLWELFYHQTEEKIKVQ